VTFHFDIIFVINETFSMPLIYYSIFDNRDINNLFNSFDP
jgi:hypothetical protein